MLLFNIETLSKKYLYLNNNNYKILSTGVQQNK